MKNRLILFICFGGALLFADCTTRIKSPAILLFNGAGTSPNDVEAVEDILSSNQMDFALVNSDQLNKMDSNQLRKSKLIIIPGGDFIKIGNGLTKEATTNIQQAVHHGLNYLGICAGGFLAGNTHSNSFNIANDVQVRFYSAEEKGIRKMAVSITNADGSVIDHYWEDGPQFTGWGEVISKYPDGTPATVQGSYGSGWVVLTGLHPEAPESWRREFHFSTPIDDSHRYAAMLMKSAIEKKTMAHF